MIYFSIQGKVVPLWYKSDEKMDKLTIYRKPIDAVLMFKVIFLQRYYGLGDHQIQY
jgi:hypothetical protein